MPLWHTSHHQLRALLQQLAAALTLPSLSSTADTDSSLPVASLDLHPARWVSSAAPCSEPVSTEHSRHFRSSRQRASTAKVSMWTLLTSAKSFRSQLGLCVAHVFSKLGSVDTLLPRVQDTSDRPLAAVQNRAFLFTHCSLPSLEPCRSVHLCKSHSGSRVLATFSAKCSVNGQGEHRGIFVTS